MDPKLKTIDSLLEKNATFGKEKEALQKKATDAEQLVKTLQDQLKAAETVAQSAAADAALQQKLTESNKEVARLNALAAQQAEKIKKQDEVLAFRANISAPSAEAVDTSKAPPSKELESFLKAAEAAEKEGKKDIALYNFENAVKLSPKDTVSLRKAGLLASELGDYPKAAGYLETVATTTPNDTGVLSALGYVSLKQGNSLKAVSFFSRAASIEPQNPEWFKYLGIACGNAGWGEAAVKNLKKALEMNPSSAETAYNLAVILMTIDPPRKEESRKWYETAKKLGIPADQNLEKLLK